MKRAVFFTLISFIFLPFLLNAQETSRFLYFLKKGSLDLAITEYEKNKAKSIKGKTAVDTAELILKLSYNKSTKIKDKAYTIGLELLDRPIPTKYKNRASIIKGKMLLEKAKLISTTKRDKIYKKKELLFSSRSCVKKIKEFSAREILKEADLILIHLQEKYKILRSETDIAEITREALTFSLDEKEQNLARKWLGMALVKLGKAKEALNVLSPIIAEDPSNPILIEPLASNIYSFAPSLALKLLYPVVQKEPNWKEKPYWVKCLSLFYKTFERASSRTELKYSLIKKNLFVLSFPKKWGHALWQPGFRVWRAEGTSPSKIYAGKLKIQIFLPFSKGWRRTGRPASDLIRWRNSPFSASRGPDGPFIAFYWFGPDLKYWYGTGPRTKGITGKAVKGSNKTGIASLVSKYCYGKKAKIRSLNFKPTTPLPFQLGVKSGVIKKAWKRTTWIYDERFFSAGRFTCEFVLKIKKKHVSYLKPELNWMYKKIKVLKK